MKVVTYAVLATVLFTLLATGAVPSAQADLRPEGIIVNPNTGTYAGMVPPTPAPRNEAERLAREKGKQDARIVLSDYSHVLRLYRYVYIGGGVHGGNLTQVVSTPLDQAPDISQRTSGSATVGLDFDGLTQNTPFILEARGNFGFSPNYGETAIFTYLGIPIVKNWFRLKRGYSIDGGDDKHWATAFLENTKAYEEWGNQFLPVKIELGIGYMGISIDQEDGTVIDGGTNARTDVSASIGGLAYAGRIGYYGKQNMLRLTVYYLADDDAETGGKFQDPFFGGSMDMEDRVSGRMVEAKLDWYHRINDRVRAGKIFSGYGLSLIGRKIHMATGEVTTARSWTGTQVTTVFPEQEIYQVELLVTIGYMR